MSDKEAGKRTNTYDNIFLDHRIQRTKVAFVGKDITDTQNIVSSDIIVFWQLGVRQRPTQL
ncbi:hypothetical protein WG66_016769 [Moniliophthora roreri]|nr:hypothetical protein WG66_016769 [Moniliophthora roreri]